MTCSLSTHDEQICRWWLLAWLDLEQSQTWDDGEMTEQHSQYYLWLKPLSSPALSPLGSGKDKNWPGHPIIMLGFIPLHCHIRWTSYPSSSTYDAGIIWCSLCNQKRRGWRILRNIFQVSPSTLSRSNVSDNANVKYLT